MKPRKKTHLLTACLMFGSFLLPLISLVSPASAAGDSDLKNDARMEGYKGRPMALDSGVAPYYLLFGALGLLGASVMFKDAKRSHLD